MHGTFFQDPWGHGDGVGVTAKLGKAGLARTLCRKFSLQSLGAARGFDFYSQMRKWRIGDQKKLHAK